MNDLIKIWQPANIEKGDDGKIWVSGMASTEDKDLQGEVIKADGIILDYFLTKGYINDNHSKDTADKVGIPVEATVHKKGLWIKGFLLDTPKAIGIYELAQALKKAGGARKLGFSVEGKVLERDDKDPKVIKKCWLKDVALTAEAVNPNTYAEFSKSFGAQDLREVFVDHLTKGNQEGYGEDSNEEDAEEKKESKAEDFEDKQEAKEQKPDKPVRQKDIEEKDAEKTAEEALTPEHDKEDIEKELNDVPVAKRAYNKSIFEDSDITKSFVKVHSIGGERDYGDKKVPIHTTKYKHRKSGNCITVTGKEGAFAVLHSLEDQKGENENIGMHIFVDDPKNKKKATELVDEHLKGFGIKHQFADKNKLMGKSFVIAQDDTHRCDVCNSRIHKGMGFAVYDSKRYCDEDCMQKALVSGYAFGVTDQVDGGALRVESLEGSVADEGYAGEDSLKLKRVHFSTERANGGRTSVTLGDALDYFANHGIPQPMANRILLLMQRNDGKLPSLPVSKI